MEEEIVSEGRTRSQKQKIQNVLTNSTQTNEGTSSSKNM